LVYSTSEAVCAPLRIDGDRCPSLAALGPESKKPRLQLSTVECTYFCTGCSNETRGATKIAVRQKTYSYITSRSKANSATVHWTTQSHSPPVIGRAKWSAQIGRPRATPLGALSLSAAVRGKPLRAGSYLASFDIPDTDGVFFSVLSISSLHRSTFIS